MGRRNEDGNCLGGRDAPTSASPPISPNSYSPPPSSSSSSSLPPAPFAYTQKYKCVQISYEWRRRIEDAEGERSMP